MTAGARRASRGAWAEEAALRFLVAQGLQPVLRNYRCRFGEIDLVMRDGETLVFAEVRYRGTGAWVDAVDSVDAGKQRRLRVSAEHFLQRHAEHAACACRFDVVGIAGGARAPQVDWIKDAFGA